jgi:HSP20 family protein
MTLQTWRPFAELRRRNNFNTRFGFPFYGSRPGSGAYAGARYGTKNVTENGIWQIPLDIVDKGDELVVSAFVPGIDPTGIKLNIDDGVLAIKAETPVLTASQDDTDIVEPEYLRRERRTESFTRAVQLPDTGDQEKVTSAYANGVLTITLPQSER